MEVGKVAGQLHNRHRSQVRRRSQNARNSLANRGNQGNRASRASRINHDKISTSRCWAIC